MRRKPSRRGKRKQADRSTDFSQTSGPSKKKRKKEGPPPWDARRPILSQYRQFGGGTDSRAGDAGVLDIMNSRKLLQIDGGAGTQRKNREKFLTAARKREKKRVNINKGYDSDAEDIGTHQANEVGFNTHGHADHEFTKADLKSMGRVLYGESPSQAIVDAPIAEEVTTNGEEVFRWRSKHDVKLDGDGPIGRIEWSGTAIYPGGSTMRATDENAKSMGIMLKTEWRAMNAAVDNAPLRLHTYVSLGDMTERGQESVLDVWSRDGEEPVNILKLAHHGSLKNFKAIPEGMVNVDTMILSSGVTKVPAGQFLSELKRIGANPNKTFFLLAKNTEQGRTKAWEGSTTHVKTLENAGVRFVNDFIIKFNDLGQVQTLIT
ncbi:hypothetical protein SPB21_13625 [Leptothoe sp. ISB3NOV94-8A]